MSKDVVRKVGRRIKELRQKRGWSQEKLAEECGLHRTYIGQVERGEKSIGVEPISRIMVALWPRTPGACGPSRQTREDGAEDSLHDLSGLVSEYSGLFGGRVRPGRRAVEAALIVDADWTPDAAQHLVQLAHDYGAFMLRNAAAISMVLGIEDGGLGF